MTKSAKKMEKPNFFFLPGPFWLHLQAGWNAQAGAGSLIPAGIGHDLGQRRRERPGAGDGRGQQLEEGAAKGSVGCNGYNIWLQRRCKAAASAARDWEGEASALPRAKARRNFCVAVLQRPPTSTARTTSWQRPCRPNSGYVRRLLSSAWVRARPGSVSAPGRGQPSRWMGLTNVTSTATCAPWKDGRPLATPSVGRHWWTAPCSRGRHPLQPALLQKKKLWQNPQKWLTWQNLSTRKLPAHVWQGQGFFIDNISSIPFERSPASKDSHQHLASSTLFLPPEDWQSCLEGPTTGPALAINIFIDLKASWSP